ncbi:MAG TPA: hypothetical protein VHE14_03455 [Solirubrobacteraceae bacterium]|nr:hypothetical protein [Solirubrobacteraceae bacterium]
MGGRVGRFGPTLLGVLGALALAGSLWLKWYHLPRHNVDPSVLPRHVRETLEPRDVNAWDAFRSVKTVLAVAAGAALLSEPLGRFWRSFQTLRMLIGLGTFAIVLRAIVSPPPVPPKAGVAQHGHFVTPSSVEIGAVIALVAAAMIALGAIVTLLRTRPPEQAEA